MLANEINISKLMQQWQFLTKIKHYVRYLNYPLSHLTLTFEYWTSILSGIHMNKVFRWLVFRSLLYNSRLVPYKKCDMYCNYSICLLKSYIFIVPRNLPKPWANGVSVCLESSVWSVLIIIWLRILKDPHLLPTPSR